jgi:hypothetical protein
MAIAACLLYAQHMRLGTFCRCTAGRKTSLSDCHFEITEYWLLPMLMRHFLRRYWSRIGKECWHSMEHTGRRGPCRRCKNHCSQAMRQPFRNQCGGSCGKPCICSHNNFQQNRSIGSTTLGLSSVEALVLRAALQVTFISSCGLTANHSVVLMLGPPRTSWAHAGAH